MVAALQGMEIGQVAPPISRSLEFSAHSCLPLQQKHLTARIFRRPQRRRHTGSAAANDPNNHA